MAHLSEEEAIEHLKKAIEQLRELEGSTASSPKLAIWRRNTAIALKHIFGEDCSQISELYRVDFNPPPRGPQVLGGERDGAREARRERQKSESFESGLQHANYAEHTPRLPSKNVPSCQENLPCDSNCIKTVWVIGDGCSGHPMMMMLSPFRAKATGIRLTA